jgi:ABC-2 type transport system ATP-binding protein
MPAPAVEFSNVSKLYPGRLRSPPVPAVSDLSFEVAPGEICAFLGSNGAGKSTCINLMMGFLFPTSGVVRVLGCCPGDTAANRRIGFLPENFSFHRYLTAPRLLQFHLALCDGGSARQPRIQELLEQVKLQGFEQLRVGKYSRGMLQRLGLAQALLCNPQLLILDEPTSGLDPAGRRDVLELLTQLRAGGTTVLLSSHILPEIEQICDRVIIIDRGRLVRAGRLQDIVTEQDRVEIVVDHITAAIEQAAVAHGALIERESQKIRLVVAAAERHELTTALLNAGCDVLSISPIKQSLEDIFLKNDNGRTGPSV